MIYGPLKSLHLSQSAWLSVLLEYTSHYADLRHPAWWNCVVSLCQITFWSMCHWYILYYFLFFSFWCCFIWLQGELGVCHVRLCVTAAWHLRLTEVCSALSFCLDTDPTWAVQSCHWSGWWLPLFCFPFSRRDIFLRVVSGKAQCTDEITHLPLSSKMSLMQKCLNFSLLFMRTPIYWYLCAIVNTWSTSLRGARATNYLLLFFFLSASISEGLSLNLPT